MAQTRDIARGRTAVITGGSRGIGFELARALAGEGMNIVLSSRGGPDLEESAERLRRETGAKVVALACDVSQRAQVQALAEAARAAFGEVDLVCANAGVTTAGLLEHHQPEDWDWAIGINLLGATHCVEAFYPAMVARGSGTILLTGSQTTLVPDWVLGHGPYVAAKAGVFALAFGLRAEAERHGVNVSLLLPAATETTIAETARLVPPETGRMEVREGLPTPNAPFFLSPAEVAARALDGLRRNAPLIATHAGMRPLVQDYFDRILAAYDAAEAFTA